MNNIQQENSKKSLSAKIFRVFLQTLFKILQEGIGNALQDIRGSKVAVTIKNDEEWKVTTADDGSGLLSYANPATGCNGRVNTTNKTSVSNRDIVFQPIGQSETIVMISPDKLKDSTNRRKTAVYFETLL